MYQIDLIGSDTAQCDEMGLSVTREKSGIIDILARRMIEAGADPEAQVEVYREETLCFLPRPLRSWGAWRLKENGKTGFHMRRRTRSSFETKTDALALAAI